MQNEPAGPTLALMEIRELVKARSNQAPPMEVAETLRNGHRLAELIGWLDQHIASSGSNYSLPEQWERTTHGS